MSLPASREFAVEVVQRLVDAGYEALWAGGCVRDFLMGNEPSDFDVATSARPEEVRAVFGKRRTLAIGESFGVIVVLGPDRTAGQVEVATFRTDSSYSDGRRPDTVTFSTAREDARRRDFTINGMFYDPLREQLIDYVGGRIDLEYRILRAIGDPEERIEEDKLRMLRAIRFAAKFDFNLDQRTAEAIRKLASEIRVVSQERITEELRKMLAHASRAKGIRMLDEAGLLPLVLPDLEEPWSDPDYAEQSLRMLASEHDGPCVLSLAILFRQLPTEADISGIPAASKKQQLRASPVVQLGKRLRLSNREIETIRWLVDKVPLLLRGRQLPLHQLKGLLAHEHRDMLLEMARLLTLGQGAEAREHFAYCQEYLSRTPAETLNPPPLLNGADLIALGLKPGHEFSQLLEQVRHAQLDEQISQRQQAIEWINKHRNEQT